MKKILILVIAVFAISLTGCSPISVRTDYDREVNFTNYQTFRWMPYPKNKKGKVPRNSLVDKRIRRAVERELEALGYEVRNEGKVDALLAYHVGVRNRVDVDHYGYRYWRRHTHVRRYKEGSIVIDIIDPADRQLVWRGVASGVAGRQEQNAEQVNEAIAKVFKKYPPS